MDECRLRGNSSFRIDSKKRSTRFSTFQDRLANLPQRHLYRLMILVSYCLPLRTVASSCDRTNMTGTNYMYLRTGIERHIPIHHRSRPMLTRPFRSLRSFPNRPQVICGKSSRYWFATSTTISSSVFISNPKASRTFSRSANPTFNFFVACSENSPISKARLKDTRAMPISHTMSGHASCQLRVRC